MIEAIGRREARRARSPAAAAAQSGGQTRGDRWAGGCRDGRFDTALWRRCRQIVDGLTIPAAVRAGRVHRRAGAPARSAGRTGADARRRHPVRRAGRPPTTPTISSTPPAPPGCTASTSCCTRSATCSAATIDDRSLAALPDLLLPNLSADLVRRVLGRSDYSAAQEQEAELVASMIAQRARRDPVDSPGPSRPRGRRRAGPARLHLRHRLTSAGVPCWHWLNFGALALAVAVAAYKLLRIRGKPGADGIRVPLRLLLLHRARPGGDGTPRPGRGQPDRAGAEPGAAGRQRTGDARRVLPRGARPQHRPPGRHPALAAPARPWGWPGRVSLMACCWPPPTPSSP